MFTVLMNRRTGIWHPRHTDELVATFLSVAVSQIQAISPKRAATLVLRQFEVDFSDVLERRLRGIRLNRR